jgi:hypothetical protein
LAFVNFSLTGIERMEGTVVNEFMEDVARALIVAAEEKIVEDGLRGRPPLIPYDEI